MHGIIFASFRDFARDSFGSALDGVWREQDYLPGESYDDEEFLRLLGRACEGTGLAAKDMLRRFGVFAGSRSFAALYPDYYAKSGNTRTFLLSVEERIHELVRSTIPYARPPHLQVRPLGEEGVVISYTSERRLCALLEGLVAGTAEHYGERLTIREVQCMHRGDAGCAFLVEPAGAEAGYGFPGRGVAQPG